MKWQTACVWLLFTLSLLLCGGNSRAAGYTENKKHNFLSSCIPKVKRDSESPGFSSKYCNCLWHFVSADIPFDEFVKLDNGEASVKTNWAVNGIYKKCGAGTDEVPEYAQ
tara:strand:- start:160 stop:489 length:330 start_codon:yes stop_codon:yes gene_type:complete